MKQIFTKAIHEGEDPESGFKQGWLWNSCENCLGLLLCVPSQKSSSLWRDAGEDAAQQVLDKGGCETPETERVMSSAPVLSH